MKRISLILTLTLTAVLGEWHARANAQETWPEPDPALLERARALLKEVPLIDGHNDLPSSMLEFAGGDFDRLDIARLQVEHPADIPRLREGMVGGQFWAAFVDTAYMDTGDSLKQALTEIDFVHRLVDRYPELEMALTADDIERLHGEGKIASMIGVEGGHGIESSLAALRMFHKLGVRYMTLTHFRTHDWADAATDFPRHGGLTEHGENIVREMNRLGIFVDLSHVSPDTMEDALRVTRAPVIYSHSNASAINAHARNVPDKILRLLPDNGSVVMVNFIAGYVPPTPQEWRNASGPEAEQVRFAVRQAIQEPAWQSGRDAFAEGLRAELDDEAEIARRLAVWDQEHPYPRGTVGDVADHIDHIRDVAGIDHVGIGSDYYDAGGPSMSVGLENVSKLPVLIAELLRRGYSDEDAKKVAGLNLLRAMREMERVARELQQSQKPLLDRQVGARP